MFQNILVRGLDKKNNNQKGTWIFTITCIKLIFLLLIHGVQICKCLFLIILSRIRWTIFLWYTYFRLYHHFWIYNLEICTHLLHFWSVEKVKDKDLSYTGLHMNDDFIFRIFWTSRALSKYKNWIYSKIWQTLNRSRVIEKEINA